MATLELNEVRLSRREGSREVPNAQLQPSQPFQPQQQASPQQPPVTEVASNKSNSNSIEDKKKQCSVEEKHLKRSGPKPLVVEKMEKTNDELGTSTKFVVLNAKMRSAQTKLRKRNIMQPRGIKPGGAEDQTADGKHVELVEEIASDKVYSHIQKLEEENHLLKSKITEFKLKLEKKQAEIDALRQQLAKKDSLPNNSSVITARPGQFTFQQPTHQRGICTPNAVQPQTEDTQQLNSSSAVHTATNMNMSTAYRGVIVHPQQQKPLAPQQKPVAQKQSSPQPPQTQSPKQKPEQAEHSIYL